MYQIRNAQYDDLAGICELYDSARAFMAATGNPTQWAGGYPGVDVIRQDIREGNGYVVTDGAVIHGVFMFRMGEDPTYLKIWDGQWSIDAPYGVIHRIAGDGSGGILAACLAFCSERTDYLRIDTHRDNRVMRHLLEKHGFSRRGIILTTQGSERIAFDRMKKTADM